MSDVISIYRPKSSYPWTMSPFELRFNENRAFIHQVNNESAALLRLWNVEWSCQSNDFGVEIERYQRSTRWSGSHCFFCSFGYVLSGIRCKLYSIQLVRSAIETSFTMYFHFIGFIVAVRAVKVGAVKFNRKLDLKLFVLIFGMWFDTEYGFDSSHQSWSEIISNIKASSFRSIFFIPFKYSALHYFH